MSYFSIRFESSELTFVAQHAIQYRNGRDEELHEHEFRVVAEISGPLNEVGYVVDFVLAKRLLLEVLGTLDKKVLVSQNEDTIRSSDPQILILPVERTTAELLAEYIADLFARLLVQRGGFARGVENYRMCLKLEEEPGMWAVCQKEVDDSMSGRMEVVG